MEKSITKDALAEQIVQQCNSIQGWFPRHSITQKKHVQWCCFAIESAFFCLGLSLICVRETRSEGISTEHSGSGATGWMNHMNWIELKSSDVGALHVPWMDNLADADV